jgi:hypothetical protein
MSIDERAEIVDSAAWQASNVEARSPWRRGLSALRDAWSTLGLNAVERRYQQRALRRLARGERLGTLGNRIQDEAETRQRAVQWRAHLAELGLKPDHLCVEYGCGSLWCAEPVIQYLQPGRFIGHDLTDRFYELGRQRLTSLVAEKQPRTAVISRRTLREVARLKPDFVYSHRVLHHIQRRGLARYVRNLLSLLDDRSVLVIENVRPTRADGSPKGRSYSADNIRVHLPPKWQCRQEPFGLVITRRAA